MSKKKFVPPQPAKKSELLLLSERGKKVFGIGIGLAVLGYGILTFADPAGQNWASRLSPFFLVAGYAILAFGIIIPPKNPQN